MEKNRIIMWAAIILGIFGFLWLLTTLATGSSGEESRSLNDDITLNEEHVKGNPEGSIIIVEYSDFQCPACASAYPMAAQAVEEFDDVALVYRHFPLRSIHPEAQLAAQAAEAAAMQGQFWEMHDALFNTQSQWSGVEGAGEYFVRLAGSLGLDEEQFRTDMNSDAARDAVGAEAASASALRLRGTPSFFINGEQQQFGTYEQLRSIIEDARNS